VSKDSALTKLFKLRVIYEKPKTFIFEHNWKWYHVHWHIFSKIIVSNIVFIKKFYCFEIFWNHIIIHEWVLILIPEHEFNSLMFNGLFYTNEYSHSGTKVLLLLFNRSISVAIRQYKRKYIYIYIIFKKTFLSK